MREIPSSTEGREGVSTLKVNVAKPGEKMAATYRAHAGAASHRSGARPIRRSASARVVVRPSLGIGRLWRVFAYRALNADKRQRDARLPVLGALQDEIIERLTNFRVLPVEGLKQDALGEIF